jgi:hypothetical protein
VIASNLLLGVVAGMRRPSEPESYLHRVEWKLVFNSTEVLQDFQEVSLGTLAVTHNFKRPVTVGSWLVAIVRLTNAVGLVSTPHTLVQVDFTGPVCEPLVTLAPLPYMRMLRPDGKPLSAQTTMWLSMVCVDKESDIASVTYTVRYVACTAAADWHRRISSRSGSSCAGVY